MSYDDDTVTWECVSADDLEDGTIDMETEREFCVTVEAAIRNYSTKSQAEEFSKGLAEGKAALKSAGFDMTWE